MLELLVPSSQINSWNTNYSSSRNDWGKFVKGDTTDAIHSHVHSRSGIIIDFYLANPSAKTLLF
jgi:hypothetical protein